jgi:hypothetical protein
MRSREWEEARLEVVPKSAPDHRIVRRQQVKECLISISIGSDTRKILEALLGGSPSWYGIDTLGEGPRLMVTIDQQDERPPGLSLDLL